MTDETHGQTADPMVHPFGLEPVMNCSSATRSRGAWSLPSIRAAVLREEFKREVDRYLTGKDTEPWEIRYFKAYKSQLPVTEQALLSGDDLCGLWWSQGWEQENLFS